MTSAHPLILLLKQPKVWLALACTGVLAVLLWGATSTLLTESLTLNGIVQAHEIQDASRLGGRISDVLVAEGDTVTKGQLLVRFDDRELAARLNQAEALVTQTQAQENLVAAGANGSDLQSGWQAVKQAEQAVQLAQRGGTVEVSKAQAMVSSAESALSEAKQAADNGPDMLAAGIISEQKLAQINEAYTQAQSQLKAVRDGLVLAKRGAGGDQVGMARSRLISAQANYNRLRQGARPNEVTAANASVDQAKGQLDVVKTQLNESEIRARMNGTVSVLTVKTGDLVLPGQPIVTLINPNDLWVDVFVPENKLNLVMAGKTVFIKATALKKALQFSGHVTSINPKSEFVPSGSLSSGEVASFRIKVELTPTDASGKVRLYPGMSVQVTLKG